MKYKTSVLLTSLSVAALAQVLPAHAETVEQKTVERIDYICQRSVVVPVTYIKTGELPALAVLHADVLNVALPWHDSSQTYVALAE